MSRKLDCALSTMMIKSKLIHVIIQNWIKLVKVNLKKLTSNLNSLEWS